MVTEQDFIERATGLQEAIQGDSLQAFAEGRTELATQSDAWKALLSLFKADSRDELVTLLGFSKEEVAARVAEAVESLKLVSYKSSEQIDEYADGKQRESVVSFAEPERREAEESDGETPGSEPTDKSEAGTSAEAASDAASGVPLDTESTTTVPSLFGDDFGPGTPQEDFFNTIVQDGGDHHTVHVPHLNYPMDSSVAATIGSRASSVSSEIMKNNTFKIYPADESETDRLVTKALVLGDFESAVSLCLSSDRFADAILLAVRGGPELLQRTQRAYFERRTTTLPYLRLFQSIVSNDLSDIVQNADLQEWREIFVVLCTFAKDDEFPGLAEQLGARLEFQSVVSEDEQYDVEDDEYANEFRRNATLTYLAAARLERLVNIWNEEMSEEEKIAVVSGDGQGSRYSAHVHGLQTFIEKVTVFRAATKYVDEDLEQKSVRGVDGDVLKTYKLASLYDRYFEYAEMLATQGLVKEAAEFIKLTPTDYKVKGERERLLTAAGVKPSPAAAAVPAVAATTTTTTATTTSVNRAPTGPYGGYPTTFPNTVPQPMQTSYSSYNPPAHSTAAAVPTAPYAQGQYMLATQMQAQQPTATGYGGSRPSHPTTVHPPPFRGPSANPTHPPPPPPKRDNGGWNDAPMVPSTRPLNNLNLNKPNAITSPFPNATPSPGYVSPTLSAYGGQAANAPLPPPPRPSSVQQQQRVMPPPQAGQRVQPPPPGPPGPQQHQHPGIGYPPIRRPTSTTGVPPRQPTPSQYAPPPGRVPIGQTPPPPHPQMGRGPIVASPPKGQGPPGPGMYVRGTPSPAQFGHGGAQSSPPPVPQQHQPGPYAPPPQQQMQRTAPPPLGGQQLPGQSLQAPQPPTPSMQSSQGPPPGPGPARVAPISRAPTGPPPPKYRKSESFLSSKSKY